MSEPQQHPDGKEKLRLPVAHPSAYPYTARLLLLELLETLEADPSAVDRLVVVFDDEAGGIHFRWSSQRLADVSLLQLALGDGIVAALRGELPGFDHAPATREEVDDDGAAQEQPCPDAQLVPLRPEEPETEEPA